MGSTFSTHLRLVRAQSHGLRLHWHQSQPHYQPQAVRGGARLMGPRIQPGPTSLRRFGRLCLAAATAVAAATILHLTRTFLVGPWQSCTTKVANAREAKGAFGWGRSGKKAPPPRPPSSSGVGAGSSDGRNTGISSTSSGTGSPRKKASQRRGDSGGRPSHRSGSAPRSGQDAHPRDLERSFFYILNLIVEAH